MTVASKCCSVRPCTYIIGTYHRSHGVFHFNDGISIKIYLPVCDGTSQRANKRLVNIPIHHLN